MNNVISNYVKVFKNCTNFTGRAGRDEFWLFVVVNFAVSLILGVVDGITGIPVLGLLYTLAALLPGIAVGIRRLHDTGRPGWWILIGLIPFLGALVLIVLFAMPSKDTNNQFGPAPAPVMA